MKTTIDFVFYHSLFLTTLLGGVSFVLSKRLKSQQILHLAELWVSLGAMMVVSYLLRSPNEHFVALSLLGWIWPIKCILQIGQDLSGQPILMRPKVVVLAVGAFLSLVFISYSQPFRIYTTPFCLSVGVVGVMLMRDIYKSMTSYSLLANLTVFFLAWFFIVRAFYPLWITSDLQIFGTSANFMMMLGLGAVSLGHYFEIMKDKEEKNFKGLLKARNDQLLGQSKYSELGMMSAGIAHEINNPLAIIQAKTTQLLRIHTNPERQKELTEGLEQILYTSERINRTIQGVRDFVHQDERMVREEFSIKTLVDDVMAFCSQRMKNHGVNLRFYGLEKFMLRGNKIQLEQVLLNLLNNSFDAIEYLPDKWIELSVHETDHTLQMYFKDSGSGIPPEVAIRIMEPFYTTKNIGKGTGLGLALARGIVEKHGGALAYVSNTRHTTFVLELPKIDSKLSGLHGHRKILGPDSLHH